MRAPRKNAGRGFTLIEVLVAVSILAIVVGLTWGSFQQTFKAKATIETNAVRYHSVRLTLERLTRELTMAYVSKNEDAAQPDRRTFFIGRRKGDIDELRFSMMGHQRLYADAAEGDTSQVAYYGLRDRNTGKMNLARRETRRLSLIKLEEAAGSADVLCDDVVRLQFDYYDSRDKAWREEWATTAADGQPDRLPSRVKITLTVHDERNNEVPFTTSVRLPLQEAIELTPKPLVYDTP